MHQLLQFTATSAVLCAVIVLILLLVVVESVYRAVTGDRRRRYSREGNADGGVCLKEAPTPRRLPLIGHMHLLAGYEVPYEAFSALGRRYGSVVRLQLGSVRCVVVNEQRNIREALVTKGHHFDARPNFQRYQQLFSGNKENSLAFCDWSETQKTRRDMLRAFTFPRAFTHKFNSLERLIGLANRRIAATVEAAAAEARPVELKPLLLRHCANVFTSHFCSREFDAERDIGFLQMVEDFDEIFYEVNQGYAADFLPFLLPLHKKNLERISGLTHNIRRFVLDRIVGNRYEEMDMMEDQDPADYVDSLVRYSKGGEQPELPWETALFALEDILGGHSAVGNFLTRLFGFLVNEEAVQAHIQAEIDAAVGAGGRPVTICDRTAMPYTEAAIFEAIRLIASPIVPRVANQDSSVDGYLVEKDTVLFLNNYELSMSEQLWERPAAFRPERFVRDGRIFKPDHFLPFGGGRRGCMGYKMVQLISFGVLAGLLQHYTVRPAVGGGTAERQAGEKGETYKAPVGSLALPKHTFKFCFERRR